ncbi:MAG: VCBS repeat-containing protein [Acidobacteria bacterium]|nr:VCBS repeat-containing protein [Acidobacteriota bacterium]
MSRPILSLAFLFLCFSNATAVPQRAVFDFDGDNRTDYAVVRSASNTWNWYLQQSSAGFKSQPWGLSGTDFLVPGDYDGDMKWDIAVWRQGTFYILQSSNEALRAVPFGQAGDDPKVTQDFDGDGKADPAVTRNVGGTLTWYVQRSLLGFMAVTFGNATTDFGTRGDFDGDGKADVAVFRKTTSTPAQTYYVLRSSDGGLQVQTFAIFSGNAVFPADFDGDGKTDYAIWLNTNAGWYWVNSSDNSFHVLAFGLAFADVAVPGDYDGDGKTDHALWRDSTGIFYVQGSISGFMAVPFGTSGDVPAANNLQVH